MYGLKRYELYVHVVMRRMVVLLNVLQTWSAPAVIRRGNSPAKKPKNIEKEKKYPVLEEDLAINAWIL